MIMMSPRAKNAAGGPSVLSEEIISEGVEEIEFSGGTIHQRRIHHDAAGSRDRDQHGWTRALPRQHLCRALVVDREARMGLPASSDQRHRTEAQPCRVLRLV